MSKILVTGAAGFIGSQLAHRLWKDGEQVVLADNISQGTSDNLLFEDCDLREQLLQIDVRDQDAVYRLFREERFDYVYHFAGILNLAKCQDSPAEAAEVNVVGTVNILKAGQLFGVTKILFASSSAVYENSTDFPSVEEQVVSPSLIYSTTKYTAEQFCKSFADAYGMNVACLRFADVYGPRLDYLRPQPPVIGYLIREYYFDRRPVLHSSGKQRRDFIYVDDVVELAVRVQKGTGYDVVNVSTGIPYSINELADIVAKLMGKEHIHPVYVSPDRYWNNYPELLHGAYPMMQTVMEKEVLKYICLKNMHAKEVYGWEPKVNLEEGIRRTILYCVSAIGQMK